MAKAPITIGRLEHIALPGLEVLLVEVKVDTGAYSSARLPTPSRPHRGGHQMPGGDLPDSGIRKVKVFRSFQTGDREEQQRGDSRHYLISTEMRLNEHVVRNYSRSSTAAS